MKILSTIFLSLVLFTVFSFSQLPSNYPFKSYIDNNNDLFVAGESNNDMAVYIVSGNSVGSVTFGNSGFDRAHDVVTDKSGCIYAAGYTDDLNSDIMLVKFDLSISSQYVWDEIIDLGLDDKAYSITADENDYIYICGYVTSSAGNTDFLVAKYNTDGILDWYKILELPGNQYATDILTDGNFVYAIGYIDASSNPLSMGNDVILQIINLEDTSSVHTVLNLPFTSEIPLSFKISENLAGNLPRITSKLVVGGFIEQVNLFTVDRNYFLAHFEADTENPGNQVYWYINYGTADVDDIGTAVTVDNNGNPVITGYMTRNNNFDFGTMKIDKGTQQILWGPRYFDISGNSDKATDIKYSGGKYIAAGCSESGIGTQFITQLLTEDNSSINDVWDESFIPQYINNSSYSFYRGHNAECFFTSDNGIITFMQSWNSSTSDFAVIKYDSSGNTIYTAEMSGDSPVFRRGDIHNLKFELLQNYPNPFNPVTNIKYEIPENSFVTLKVYDVLGSEVAVLVNENESAGLYSRQFNASAMPSGIYFYKLTAVSSKGHFEKTNKMILIK